MVTRGLIGGPFPRRLALGGLIAITLTGPPSVAAWSARTGGTPRGGAAVSGSVFDPSGDTFGSLTPQLDLASVVACFTASDVVISASFYTPVSPSNTSTCGAGMNRGHVCTTDTDCPDCGVGCCQNANAAYGFLDLDTDQNAATGTTPNTDTFSPYATGMGMNYYLDLRTFDLATGKADVLDAADVTTGQASVVWGPASLTATIPLTAIGGDDGVLDMATVFGTFAEPTDAAPNGGHVTTVPCAQVMGGDDTGFVPPNKTVAKCEDGVAKATGKLIAGLVKCHIDRARGKTTSDPEEDACEQVAITKFTTKTKTLTCDPCTNLPAIATWVEQTIDAGNGRIYCAAGTPFGGDDAGNVPADPKGPGAKCAGVVAKSVAKLAAGILKAHIARADGKFGSDAEEELFESAIVAKFTLKTKTIACDPCVDLAAIAASLETELDARNGTLYCAAPAGP